MSNASIAYAEDNLGVHATFNEAQSVEQDMRRQEEILLSLRTRRATLIRETAEQGADSTDRTSEVDETNEAIWKCEYALSDLGRRHASLVARLTELGGYFQYLASLKTAQSAQPKPSSSPWSL